LVPVTAHRGPPLGAGREAEILGCGEGQAVRLLRDPGGAGRLEREAAAMRAAHEADVPVPVVGAVVEVDGRPGLVMERVVGTDLLTELQRRPWRFHRRARELGSLQARLHATPAPPGLPAAREELRARIVVAPHLAEETRTRTLELLDELPGGDALCHGDFHPGNVIVGRRGPVIIDWPAACRGDPVGDLARTMLLLRVATPPDRSGVNRAVVDAGRGWFRRVWRRAYARHQPVDGGRLERWVTVHAAGRLAEGLEEETPALLALLEARFAAPA
jgi:aminoglycoside phosphotransferase (APT) family kinase protein